MKKLLNYAVITLLLAIFCLSGCAGTIPLTFKYYFSTQRHYNANLTETLTYNVKSLETFKYDNFDFSASNTNTSKASYIGTYTHKLTAGGTLLLDECETAKNNLSVSEKIKSATRFYKIETTLNVASTYIINGTTTYTFNDVVTSTVYFADCEYSLAPLYSAKSYDATVLSKSNQVIRSVYETAISYANKKATLTITDKTDLVKDADPYKDDTTNNYLLAKMQNSTTIINYDELCVLDNTSLTFAVRGLDLKENYSTSINIVDSSYAQKKPVLVKVNKVSELASIENSTQNPFTFTINGVENIIGASTTNEGYYSVNSAVVTMNFNDSTFSGTPLICYYQTVDATNYTPNTRAFPVQMYSAVPFSHGALEYKLNSITITE